MRVPRCSMVLIASLVFVDDVLLDHPSAIVRTCKKLGDGGRESSVSLRRACRQPAETNRTDPVFIWKTGRLPRAPT